MLHLEMIKDYPNIRLPIGLKYGLLQLLMLECWPFGPQKLNYAAIIPHHILTQEFKRCPVEANRRNFGTVKHMASILAFFVMHNTFLHTKTIKAFKNLVVLWKHHKTQKQRRVQKNKVNLWQTYKVQFLLSKKFKRTQSDLVSGVGTTLLLVGQVISLKRNKTTYIIEK